MNFVRVIPCLTIRNAELVKTVKYKDAVYIGDPVNAVRIFSEKEADEIVILDIDASLHDREPNYELISEMAGEAFMPVTYGGGVRTVSQIRRLIRSGVEKVMINSFSVVSKEIIKEAVDVFGSQAIVGGIDLRPKYFGGYEIVIKSGTEKPKLDIRLHIQNLIQSGIGELFINNVGRDGTMTGFDIDMIKKYSKLPVPVIVCGGAGNNEHLIAAIRDGGASAVAAGSMFIYQGRHRAVLINYPKPADLSKLFQNEKII